MEVLWITPLNENAHFNSPLATYGKEASLEYIYGNVCLIVQAGPAGQRETKKAVGLRDTSSLDEE